ncbi:N-formyl peptide receptor 2-like [Candoia aspera]|uniref:N-formyl peptide receptor 2-like n=1 Tax=Candoia aspera TaxID=51853 RepID=UPI002FD7CAAB
MCGKPLLTPECFVTGPNSMPPQGGVRIESFNVPDVTNTDDSPEVLLIRKCQYKGDATVCSCAFHSWPPPEIQWQMDKKDLTGNNTPGNDASEKQKSKTLLGETGRQTADGRRHEPSNEPGKGFATCTKGMCGKPLLTPECFVTGPNSMPPQGGATTNVSHCLHNITAVEEVMRHIAIVTNVIVLVLGVSGNGLVMWIIATRTKHKTFTSICYFNLAVADFLFSAGRIPALVQETMYNRWPFGLILCKLHGFARYLTAFTSVFILTVISLYRCLMVVKPVWARNHQSPRFQALMCIGAWTLALFFSIPYLVVRTVEVRNGASCCTYRKDLKISTELPLRLSRFLGGFLLPFFIISTAYSVLLCKLRGRRWTGCHRTISLVATIVALFFICWLPHHIFVLLSTIYPNGVNIPQNNFWGIALKLSNALAYFHSCINPVLYGFVGYIRSRGLYRRASFLGLFRKALAEEDDTSVGAEASQNLNQTT